MVEANQEDIDGDDILQDKVRCEMCDEELIRIFSSQHKCDPRKLSQMRVNSQNQRAMLDTEQEGPQ